jgi:hypothetical protein
LGNSVAVLNRPLGVLARLLSSDNELYSTFYQQVDSASRIPEDNRWDQARQAADAILFPFYFEHIRFGCLSLNGKGIPAYGEYSVTLHDHAIERRTSVFDQNSLSFVQEKRLVPGDPIPPGHRASWQRRGELAFAQCGERVSSNMSDDEFAAILIDLSGTEPAFVEVDVYGPFNRRAVAKLSGPGRGGHRSDKAVIMSIKSKLADIGAALELDQ